MVFNHNNYLSINYLDFLVQNIWEKNHSPNEETGGTIRFNLDLLAVYRVDQSNSAWLLIMWHSMGFARLG